MTFTRHDVEVAVSAAFSAGDRNTVLDLLDQYGIEPHEHEKERVQLAIMELSEGRQDKVRELVQAAKVDYRDVLAWKQLGPMSPSDGAKAEADARALIEKWGKK